MMKLIIVGVMMCGISAYAESVTIFVASSMTDTIKEIGDIFTKSTGIQVKLNVASSGTLARQI